MRHPTINEEGEFIDAVEPDSVYLYERIEWRETLADGFWLSLLGALLFITTLLIMGAWLL